MHFAIEDGTAHGDGNKLTKTSTIPLACFWNMKSCGTIAMLSKYIEKVHAVSDRKCLFSVGCTTCNALIVQTGNKSLRKREQQQGELSPPRLKHVALATFNTSWGARIRKKRGSDNGFSGPSEKGAVRETTTTWHYG